MSYKKPILSEIYCEAFFKRPIDTTIQWNIISALKESSNIIEIDPDIINPGLEPNMRVRIRLWKDGKRELLQVYYNRIAFNFIPKDSTVYEGWESFLEKSMKYINAISSSYSDYCWENVGLSYIDKISGICKDGFKLGKYINCNGDTIPRIFEDTSVATDIIIGQGNKALEDNKQLKLKLQKSGDKYDILINTSFYTLLKCSNSIYNELNKLHDKCIEIFEKIITDYVRNVIMEGVK